MGVLSAIFGSKKNTESIIDGAKRGLDKLVFTTEEKADANAKVSEWFLKYLEATQPQNLARRFLALIVAILWAVLVVAGVVAKIFSDELSKFIFEVLNEIVNAPFMLIMGFYFITHVVRTYQKGSK